MPAGLDPTDLPEELGVETSLDRAADTTPTQVPCAVSPAPVLTPRIQPKPHRAAKENRQHSSPVTPRHMHTGTAIPSLVVAQARLPPSNLFFPVTILQASYVASRLKILVQCNQSKEKFWVPITDLNESARQRFYDLRFPITRLRALRTRT